MQDWGNKKLGRRNACQPFRIKLTQTNPDSKIHCHAAWHEAIVMPRCRHASLHSKVCPRDSFHSQRLGLLSGALKSAP